MTIYLGADHRGFELKEKIKKMLLNDAYNVVDCGAATIISDDDYPDYAKKVATAVGENPGNGDDGDRGILICGSGVGIDVSANKFRNVRSALAAVPDQIYAARHDDNVNVLAIAADFIDEATAEKLVKVFLSTPFASNEPRYQRRLEKISKLEI
jgi:ribose 5-phosphate isomerase B